MSTKREPRPFTPLQVAIATPVMRWMSRLNTWLYRASGGRIWGRWMYGAPILLLTTRGRKTGRPRTTPLLYLADGERVIVVGSKGGMDHHPMWYLNLRANPEVEIQIGRQRRRMRARTASPEEKREYWPRLCEMYPDFADYQARTKRDIPVVILEPAG